MHGGRPRLVAMEMAVLRAKYTNSDKAGENGPSDLSDLI